MSGTTMTNELTGLSPAVIHVYTQLVAFTDPAPVADIAQATETACSSSFKALASLQKRGLAHRERGIPNGPSRRPDLWRATHTGPGPTPGVPPTTKKPGQPTSDAAPADTPAADTTALVSQPDECTSSSLWGIRITYDNATRTATVRSRPSLPYRYKECPRGDLNPHAR
ncbi:hypothetical protein ABZV31_03720 [Streptomyces sp. NPDC005202]|uniref:hypothetical protein n=1 Tax=Streptomyces sp. NPDC005202 TaxID=3157021 RepID=UPI00339E3038